MTWQPIGEAWQTIETAPKDQPLLGWYGSVGIIEWDKSMPDYGVDGEDDEATYGMWRDSEHCYVRPTHWMPLPAPPVRCLSISAVDGVIL